MGSDGQIFGRNLGMGTQAAEEDQSSDDEEEEEIAKPNQMRKDEAALEERLEWARGISAKQKVQILQSKTLQHNECKESTAPFLLHVDKYVNDVREGFPSTDTTDC